MKEPKSGVLWSVLLGGLLPVILAFILKLLMPDWKLLNEPFHSVIEALGLFAGLFLAALLMFNEEREKDTSHYIWISSALIGMGILDGFHAAIRPGNNFVWLHSTAVLIGGFLFSMAWMPLRDMQSQTVRRLPGFVAVASIILGVFSLVFSEALPMFLVEGNFTLIASAINVLGGGLFIVAAIFFLVRYRTSGEAEENLFAFFCFLNGSAGLLFPFGHTWGFEWWLWHLLRLIAYFILLGYIFGVFRNLTKRTKKTAEELRVAALYTRNLIEASLDPLVTISPDGKITDVNKTTEQVTGVSRERLVGSVFSDYFTEPDKAREGYQQVFAQGVVKDYPLTIRHASGRTTDVLYNASVYKNETGDVQGVFAAARDITERKRLDDELKTYREQLEEMVKKRTAELANVLKEVKDTVNVLASSSSEILAATTQVASGTAETATAISETTTTVEEVRQAAQLSSQKANNVSDSAQRVAHVSQTGQKAVEETAAVMRHIRDQMESIAQTIVRLSEQGQSIGGIIASVTDIADQSNLLAVNAAIEAARAGEQGKGFAVVAQEIKSLAEQSKQATTQVRSILNDVQKATSAAVMATEQGNKAVDAGVKQSAQAGEAIRVLAESTGEAVQTAVQIVASSQQQVVGMDQIGTAMENINQAGAETAASMRQAEVSAQNLHELGQKLKKLVEQYKI